MTPRWGLLVAVNRSSLMPTAPIQHYHCALRQGELSVFQLKYGKAERRDQQLCWLRAFGPRPASHRKPESSCSRGIRRSRSGLTEFSAVRACRPPPPAAVAAASSRQSPGRIAGRSRYRRGQGTAGAIPQWPPVRRPAHRRLGSWQIRLRTRRTWAKNGKAAGERQGERKPPKIPRGGNPGSRSDAALTVS